MNTEKQKYDYLYSVKSPNKRYGHTNHGACSSGLLKKWNPTSVIDVGCGHNEYLTTVRRILPNGVRLIGVDFSCPSADVVADIAERLPFKDKEFDVLTSFDVLEHLLPEQVEGALKEMRRVSERFILSISHVPSKNRVAGKTLHPTVMPETWWIHQLIKNGAIHVKKINKYIVGKWDKNPTLDLIGDIVLVGNGPSLLAENAGAKIDSFSEVIRFNTFHIKGYEAQVGTKTTLWSTFGKGTLPGDVNIKPQRVLYIHGEKGDVAYSVKEKYIIPAWFFDQVRKLIQCESTRADKPKLIPSSGFLVALYLIRVLEVKVIHLIGFDHFSKDNSSAHHYWINKPFKQPAEHDGEAEARIVNALENAGRIVRI